MSRASAIKRATVARFLRLSWTETTASRETDTEEGISEFIPGGTGGLAAQVATALAFALAVAKGPEALALAAAPQVHDVVNIIIIYVYTATTAMQNSQSYYHFPTCAQIGLPECAFIVSSTVASTMPAWYLMQHTGT